MVDQRFQVNLKGIIDLLSKHLYSSPRVFLRELLQNSTDAIRARRMAEPGFAGHVRIEVIPGRDGEPNTLLLQDDGIGLTEEETHRFLATIGESSKRDASGPVSTDYIGQFGIGLLSCFVVSDQITVVSQSARPGDPAAVEWKGQASGTYQVRTLPNKISAGTRVYLRCKAGQEALFEPDQVAELARHFAGMLDIPITFVAGDGHEERLNYPTRPWRSVDAAGKPAGRAELLAQGKELLNGDYLDAIPISPGNKLIEGVAYVLPRAGTVQARKDHRVYLRGMLLTEQGAGLLPDWAVFVRCVLNSSQLRPTASREGFFEDQSLEAAQDVVAEAIRKHLVWLAKDSPELLEKIIGVHYRAIKVLASEDAAFLEIIADYLPMETNMGLMSLGDYRKKHGEIKFVASRDEFRQIAQIASAQGVCLIDAGAGTDQDVLELYSRQHPDVVLEQVRSEGLMEGFAEPSLDDREKARVLLAAADEALAGFGCRVEVKGFDPAEIPTLIIARRDLGFIRMAQETQKNSDALWSGLIAKVTEKAQPGPESTLCFNLKNPTVRQLMGADVRTIQTVATVLYVQAMLMAHLPVNRKELGAMSQSLSGLISMAVNRG
jgi:molecular chaperone HtpG